ADPVPTADPPPIVLSQQLSQRSLSSQATLTSSSSSSQLSLSQTVSLSQPSLSPPSTPDQIPTRQLSLSFNCFLPPTFLIPGVAQVSSYPPSSQSSSPTK